MPIRGSILDAVRNTRLFLLPFDLRRYAVVAVVTAFVGVQAGYGSVTSLVAVGLFDGGVNTTEPPVAVVAEAVGAVDVLVVGTAVFAVAIFTSAVAEFVLIEVLRTDEEHIVRYTRKRLGDGARVFAFRSVAVVFFFATATGVTLVAERAPGSVVATAAVAALLFGVFVSLANGFTTDFVAPVMVVRGCSLVEGWRAFWGVLVREPAAFAGYAVVRSAVNLVVAVGATVAAVAVAAFYALPVAGLSLALGLTAGGFDTLLTSFAGFVLLVVVVVTYVVLVVASVAVLVQLPVRLFFRSWSLYFLGDVEEEYALIDRPGSDHEPDEPTASNL